MNANENEKLINKSQYLAVVDYFITVLVHAMVVLWGGGGVAAPTHY
jgi:hypothetical protein